MDISALLGTLLSNDSVSNMSQATNVPADSVQSILGAALPSLLTGALGQSENDETAEGFAEALSDHSANDTSDLASFIGNIDLEDGAKIVGHLLGSNSSNVVNNISEQSGASEAETSSIMSAVAPMLMSLLGQEASTQKKANSGLGIADIMGALLKNVDLGSLISGLLGGGKDEEKPSSKPKDEKEESGGLFGFLGKLFK
ncbi:MAG: DUF937 domain-containing protein [Clostridia bacterium]|nr:DUF937 domain-containing protein [Clostridia bacterium]